MRLPRLTLRPCFGCSRERVADLGAVPEAPSPAVAPSPSVVPLPAVPPRPDRRSSSAEPGAGLAVKMPVLPRQIVLDDEIREAFLADATGLFERIEPLVLGLGRSADPRASLTELGRCFHTLKGAAGSVGLTDLASLVHTLEEHLPEASGPALASLIDVLFETLAYLEGLLGLLRTAAAKPEPAVEPADSRPLPEEPVKDAPAESAASSDDGPVRISASRLDELMDLVSELIARAQALDGPGRVAQVDRADWPGPAGGECRRVSTGCTRPVSETVLRSAPRDPGPTCPASFGGWAKWPPTCRCWARRPGRRPCPWPTMATPWGG